MHAAVRSDRGADEFHQDPPYPAQHVAVAILTLLRKINKAGFRVLPVFDGISRHPLKAAGAGVVRNRSSSNAAERLQKLLKKPWPETKEEHSQILSSILKERKSSSHVTISIIAEVM